MRSARKLHSAMNGSRTMVFLAASSTQIVDMTGLFQVFVRAAEFFVQEHRAQKPPYKALLNGASTQSMTPAGGGVRIKTTNSDLMKATHEFVRLQVADHHTADTIDMHNQE